MEYRIKDAAPRGTLASLAAAGRSEGVVGWLSGDILPGSDYGSPAPRAGDICNVALAPAADEEPPCSSFPFRLGTRICIGNRFSKIVLAIAKAINRDSFPDGFARMPVVCADRAFVGFKQE